MNAYSRALAAYLEPQDRTQEALAAAIESNQPTVNRYANGRFPNAKIARKIHEATKGSVSFALWQQVAAEKFGISEAA